MATLEYLFDKDQINDIFVLTKKIRRELDEAFDLSKNFFHMLEETNLWKGRSKDTFEAFYHLLLQYHGQLTGETVNAVGKVKTVKVHGDPIEEAVTALRACLKNLDDFTVNSDSFKNLCSK